MWATPRWLQDVEAEQIQEWRQVGWPQILAKLDNVLVSRGSGNTRGPTSVTGRLIMNCCFHEERTPSLSLYPNGGYTCYGCTACGGIPEFVTKLLHLSSLEELVAFFAETAPSINPDQLQWEL